MHTLSVNSPGGLPSARKSIPYSLRYKYLKHSEPRAEGNFVNEFNNNNN